VQAAHCKQQRLELLSAVDTAFEVFLQPWHYPGGVGIVEDQVCKVVHVLEALGASHIIERCRPDLAD